MTVESVDVSVIIPMHNGGELIHEQLDALAAQRTDLNWEVIVGDNRSTDGSPDAVRARADSFPAPLTVVDAFRVQGASHARNAAAAAARGEVLAMCDADDRVAPDWVEQAFRGVREIAPMVAGANRLLSHPQRPDAPLLNPRILHGRGAQTCNAAVRRDVFLASGGFDESLPPYGVEDSDLSARVLAAGHTIAPHPGLVLYFRETTGLKAKLRKIHSSGQAEAVLWSRGHEAQGTPLAASQFVVALAALPADAVRTARARGLRSLPKWILREAAVRTGRWRGYRRWVKTGKAGEPRLPFLDGRGGAV
ncbi:glycosyltransferase family 2 protein [Micrococcus luteus]|uniref:Glycosyltransferase family 2 protein n=1 Tax=Micrococcus luteus TaxID=1270 RepID=A0AAX0VLY9_MICLU|nr:glycosyltransferase family A protein [Micrococcus luteus]MCV7630110.1 glycosyltransferase family 2 protein [Micrococcus luteus]PKZ82567.1 glycosyltransferase family 2 protein [Micrococcus luteus]